MSIERVLIVEESHLDGKKFTFEYSYFIDRQEISELRTKLGLDGQPINEISQQEKHLIATRLRNLGSLSDKEVEFLGGKIILRK